MPLVPLKLWLQVEVPGREKRRARDTQWLAPRL